MNKEIKRIEVCCGSDCMAHGAEGVFHTLFEKFKGTKTAVDTCGCLDRCEKAVNVIVDENQIFSYSKPANVVEKIENERGEPYERFTEEKLDLSEDFLGDL